MTKTTFATMDDHRASMRAWYIVDASQHTLGRLASRIAEVLMGKHRPLYTPHINIGEGVVVVNAGRVKIGSETKRDNRIYTRWSGYPGGLKETSLGEMLDDHPDRLIKLAVRRMLPKNRIGRAMLARLKVYPAAEHPHSAQEPKPLPLSTATARRV
jgi:large subunit ribosomal protein L13